MQVTVGGAGFDDINWTKLAVSTVAGALCAIPGLQWWGAGLVFGSAGVANTLFEGGNFLDAIISFGVGFAMGATIHLATKALANFAAKKLPHYQALQAKRELYSKASSKIANKLTTGQLRKLPGLCNDFIQNPNISDLATNAIKNAFGNKMLTFAEKLSKKTFEGALELGMSKIFKSMFNVRGI